MLSLASSCVYTRTHTPSHRPPDTATPSPAWVVASCSAASHCGRALYISRQPPVLSVYVACARLPRIPSVATAGRRPSTLTHPPAHTTLAHPHIHSHLLYRRSLPDLSICPIYRRRDRNVNWSLSRYSPPRAPPPLASASFSQLSVRFAQVAIRLATQVVSSHHRSSKRAQGSATFSSRLFPSLYKHRPGPHLHALYDQPFTRPHTYPLHSVRLRLSYRRPAFGAVVSLAHCFRLPRRLFSMPIPAMPFPRTMRGPWSKLHRRGGGSTRDWSKVGRCWAIGVVLGVSCRIVYVCCVCVVQVSFPLSPSPHVLFSASRCASPLFSSYCLCI